MITRRWFILSWTGHSTLVIKYLTNYKPLQLISFNQSESPTVSDVCIDKNHY